MDRTTYLLAAFFIFILAYSAYSLSPSQCAVYTGEAGCNDNGCFWCNGCANNRLGNNYGGDRCVQSSLNCTYSCSPTCGAQCTINADCHGNITVNTCYFGGICNVCSCTYRQDDCPKPGTVRYTGDGTARLCYYGTRSCGTNGCSVQSCALGDSDVCDPDNGCIDTGGRNEYLEDYRCNGNELLAKKVSYFCNATECFYSKSDTLVERCENGCDNGKCNEEFCDIYGVKTLCNRRNGFYGERYCVGNDIYQSHRTYGCGINECNFTEEARKIAACDTRMTPSAPGSSCHAGRCVNPEQIVYANYTGPVRQPQPTANTSLPTSSPVYNQGGRIFNGFLFGQNGITIPVTGSGRINFTVRQTNRLGTLVVQADDRIILEGNVAPDTYMVPFNASRAIRIYARSSDWFLFMPAVYDIRSIIIGYA